MRDILKYLYRCKEGKTMDDISKATKSKKDDVIDAMKSLSTMRLIYFESGKWFLTERGREQVKKMKK
jgi:predicted transcriptional regulator